MKNYMKCRDQNILVVEVAVVVGEVIIEEVCFNAGIILFKIVIFI